jgi:ABC-type bacteriocin/lantibiotic exporter with double-glycine peptidase domain
MAVPHHYQETIWTCGPASMRMVLEYFGIKKSEYKLVKWMRANKIIGTRVKAFPKIAERFGLNYVIMRNATIDDLRRYYKQGFKIIILFFEREEKDSHYAVIKSITKKYITFLDPSYGPEHVYKLKTFARYWYGKEDWHWFFGVMD